MSKTVPVRYTGAVSPIDVPLAGLRAVSRGDVVEVTPETAGRGPGDLVNHPPGTEPPAHHFRQEEADGSTSSYDPGSGLLAQVDNWEAVQAKATDVKTEKTGA